MTRPTPYDLVFSAFADEWFPPIKGEGEAASADTTDIAQFAKLSATQRLLEQLSPPGEDPPEPALIEQLLGLLMACYNFWVQDEMIVAPSLKALRRKAEAGAPYTTDPEVCYVQLPNNAYWGRIADDAAFEPIDGVFVVPGPHGVFFLAALGVREGREGFSQVSITVPHRDLALLPRERRDPPFESVMDGGREAGFFNVISAAELADLTLLALTAPTE